jgi:hypothetical protein
MDEIPQIKIMYEDGFVDIDLPMASFHRDAKGIQEISARGQHNGSNVGFMVSLGTVWERQDLENSNITLYWGRAEVVSEGSESDIFLRLLDQVYGTKLSPGKMRERVPFLAVGLACDPSRLENEPAKMKFFFESDTEEREASFFVNIDVQAQLVEFREKDADYRLGVVLSLSTEV